MKLSYLVDTDWCINYLRGEARTCVRLTQLKSKGLAVSAVTVAELYTGAFRATRPDKERAGVADFLADLTLLPVDAATALLFGKENARLLDDGTRIDHFDLLIGIWALTHRLTLLTNNRRHYERIEGLRIESLAWALSQYPAARACHEGIIRG